MKLEIIRCTCDHEFQNKTYGDQMRVMNPTGKMDKGSTKGTHRCTVCKKEHTKK